MSNNLFHHEQIYRGSLSGLKKNILICGCGALGSNLGDTLNRQGCSNLILLDKDRVELHNINTQVWNVDDVGKQKTSSLQSKIYEATTQLPSISSDKELTAKNANKLLKGAELIIDCFDNTESRQILKDWTKCPVLHAGLYEDYGEVIWNDQYKVPEKSGPDICDYLLARNIIMLTVTVCAEEIVRFCLGQKNHNWTITLKDFQIRKL